MSLTYYVVLPFIENDEGDLVAEEAMEKHGHAEARAAAQALSRQKAGVIAFSRTGDPATGEFQPAVEIARYGRVPDDLD